MSPEELALLSPLVGWMTGYVFTYISHIKDLRNGVRIPLDEVEKYHSDSPLGRLIYGPHYKASVKALRSIPKAGSLELSEPDGKLSLTNPEGLLTLEHKMEETK
jgi:hypothetical protein